jgi:hypothetical protein
VRRDLSITLGRTGIFGGEPADELFEHDGADLLRILALAKPWEDRACRGIVLIRVVLEIDSDGVGLEEECGDLIEEGTVRSLHLSPLSPRKLCHELGPELADSISNAHATTKVLHRAV